VVCCRHQRSFHGVNLTSLHDVALKEYFHQPVVVSVTADIWYCIQDSCLSKIFRPMFFILFTLEECFLCFWAISIIAKTLHAYCSHLWVLIINVFTFRVSRRPREMYYGHARLCAALLWQHYGNEWQSPAVIRQARRTPHALCTHAPVIKSTRLLRVRCYLQRGRSISSKLRGCCNANVKC